MTWYWYGERYESRNFWPLEAREAKLVHVTTRRDHRGAGLASRLIEDSTAWLRKDGFDCLYARIWHSHAASITAKAGWQRIAWVCVIYPFSMPVRWTRYRQAAQ